jgi:hypothetical protein
VATFIFFNYLFLCDEIGEGGFCVCVCVCVCFIDLMPEISRPLKKKKFVCSLITVMTSPISLRIVMVLLKKMFYIFL